MAKELRPPERWRRVRFHWLAAGDHTCVCQWRNQAWVFPDTTYVDPEQEVLSRGWRYVGPCDPETTSALLAALRLAHARFALLWPDRQPSDDAAWQAVHEAIGRVDANE